MSEAETLLIQHYRRRGLLLDTNLLLLYCLGSYDRRAIARSNRLTAFDVGDYERIAELIGTFDRVVTTPHILTEVSNLALNDLGRRWHYDYLRSFAQAIGLLVEEYIASNEIAAAPMFTRLALTDVGIGAVARDRYLVISVDLSLITHLQSTNVAVLNYNHIRVLA